VAVFGIHAEDQHGASRIALAQLLDELQTILARHVVVEHGDFPWHLARELDHFLAVLRLADHGEVRFRGEHLPKPLTHDRMVVGDDDFHVLPFSGMETLTRVPWLGVPVIFTSPPNRRARSCTPRRPSDFLPVISSSLMPTPLSTTSRATFSGATSSSMST